MSELHRWAKTVTDVSTSFIGEEVEVSIDRRMGSAHPIHGFIYPVNYGFISGTMSGDGEELDAYVLGIDRAVDSFRGRCIAVVRRLHERDDKLIVVPHGQSWSAEAIRDAVSFQEQFFESELLLEKGRRC